MIQITATGQIGWLGFLAWILFGSSVAVGQIGTPSTQTAPIAPGSSRTDESIDASPDLNRLLTDLVLREMPHSFEQTKGWGAQSERWDGWKWESQGIGVRPERRVKMVNHGTWNRYDAELLDPEQTFSVALVNMRTLADDQLGFELQFATELKLSARQSKWVKGVQLYSLSGSGHARVRLDVEIAVTVAAATDSRSFPPDIVFRPEVKSAKLSVDEFRLDRVSKVGGEFAQQASRALRKKLDQEIAEKETKLVEKLNRQLQKKQDRLRLPVHDALKSPWVAAGLKRLPSMKLSTDDQLEPR